MDQKTSKTLYDTSVKEIVLKNFCVGFSRGLGGFVFTLLTWFVLYLIIVNLVLPSLMGTLEPFTNLLKVLPTTKGDPGSTIQIPGDVLKQLQQLKP